MKRALYSSLSAWRQCPYLLLANMGDGWRVCVGAQAWRLLRSATLARCGSMLISSAYLHSRGSLALCGSALT